MKRPLAVTVLLLIAGCLSAGKSPYGKLDDQPPTVVSIQPPMGADAGMPPHINGGSFISITFSEQLDVESIRPGIVLRDKNRKELPLSIQLAADPTPVSYTATEDGGAQNIPMTVEITSAVGPLDRGSYQLILRTLLIDRAGNSLESEFLGAFFVD